MAEEDFMLWSRARGDLEGVRSSCRGGFLVACLAVSIAMLVPGRGAAQDAIQCVLDDDGNLPASCESFAFDIRVATVNEANGVLGGILPGDELEGTYTVNTATPDVDVTANEGRFLNALECVSLDLGDRVLSVDLTPVEITLPPAQSDPGITTINDDQQSGPGVTVFTDVASFLMGGRVS